MTIKTPPANADPRLARAFQQAAKNDGKVTKEEIQTTIEPLIKDGRGLSTREKVALKWAVEEFNITTSGKQALSNAITETAGKPVFEWQRKVSGPMQVRLGDELPRAQLDKKAAEAFAANTTNVSGNWHEEAMYAHPESGNGGTHVYGLDGEKAEQMLRFLNATQDHSSALRGVSTKTHAIYSVYESDDESHYGGIIVDKKSGKTTAFDPYNIVDIPGDRKMYEAIFGPMVDKNGKRVSDEVYEEKQYDVDIDSELQGGRHITQPHFTPAQEKRRQKLHENYQPLSEALKKEPERRVVMDWGAMSRTDNLDKELPAFADNAQSTDYRDKEREGVAFKVVDKFRDFDDAARDAVFSTIKAGSGKVKDALVEKFLANLGNPDDLKYASVELPMTIRGDTNRERKFTTVAHILVNERDGDYFTVYERQRFKADD